MDHAGNKFFACNPVISLLTILCFYGVSLVFSSLILVLTYNFCSIPYYVFCDHYFQQYYLCIVFIRPFQKRDLLCYRVWAGGCMQDGFRSISQEKFHVSSPNLLHRSSRAWRVPSLNLITLTFFSRSRRSFKVIYLKK